MVLLVKKGKAWSALAHEEVVGKLKVILFSAPEGTEKGRALKVDVGKSLGEGSSRGC